MKIGLKLNKDNVIVGKLWLANNNYSNDYIVIDTDKDIVLYKQKLTTITTNELDNEGNLIKKQSYEITDLSEYSEEYYALQQKIDKNNRIAELNIWFNEYDMQVKQYDRAKRLGLDNEIHIGDKIYKTIEELDTQANLYVKELKSLKSYSTKRNA